MNTVPTISKPRARGWIVPGVVVAILAALFSVVAVVAALGAARTTAVIAAPDRPPAAQLARTVRGARSGGGPAVRGYRVPWGYGPGPAVERRIEFGAQPGLRWLAVLVGGLLVALLAVLAAVLTWILLRLRTGERSQRGANEILERRLAEGSIDVEEFEKRRRALLGDRKRN
jgi:uncharacterized membrane protein